MTPTSKSLRVGLAFSLTYMGIEATLLLLERHVSGWGRSAHRVIESLVNFWDREVCRQVLESDWVSKLAQWIFENSPLGIGTIASMMRSLSYILLGGTFYFLIGILIGRLINKKHPISTEGNPTDDPSVNN